MRRTLSKLVIVGAALALIIGINVLITGQPASKLRRQAASQHLVGVPDDWSHHHLVFSNPGTYEQVAKDPAAYAKWLTIRYDARFIMQQMKREAAMKQGGTIAVNGFPSATGGSEDLAIGLLRQLPVGPIHLPLPAPKPMPPKPTTLKRDWSMYMGSSSAKVGVGQFPAKFSFSTTTANCNSDGTPDFVVYNTGVAGSRTQASIVAYSNLYSGCSGNVPSVYWAYNTSDTIPTSVTLSLDGSQVAFVDSTGHLFLLKWHANTTGRTVTGSLKASSPNVTITSGTFTLADVGAQISGTGITAGDTIASVLSGTTANLATAPTAHASETLTIYAEGPATPGVPPAVAASAYHACTAPCMTSITFANGAADPSSGPFVDYTDDVLYVGDATGYLHRFNPVFLAATPAETTTGGWPYHFTVCAMGSPVYDPVTGNVFGDASTSCASFGGRYHWVPGGSGGGTVTSSAQSTNTTGPAWGEGSVVDPTAGMVYTFTGEDFASNVPGVFQFSTTFASGATGNEAKLGTGSATVALYSGAFDNAYMTSTAATPTGYMWVCGNTGGNPALYPIHFNNGTMSTGAITAATTVSATATTCSPVSEFYNSSTSKDYIFVSPQTEPASGQVSGCSASTGCVISYTVSGTTATLSGAGPFPGGGSGMVVDTQSSSHTGTLQLYFSNLGTTMSCGGSSGGGGGTGTGGCAIQASQPSP